MREILIYGKRFSTPDEKKENIFPIINGEDKLDDFIRYT